MDTTMIDRQVLVLVDSNHKHKVDSQQRQHIQHQHSHQINQVDRVDTIIQHKLIQTSQQHHQVEQLDIHQVHNNVQQMLVLVHMHHHRLAQLADHIQDKDKLNDQELVADHSQDKEFQAQADLVKEILADSNLVQDLYHHHLHQAVHHQVHHKTKVKKEIIQLFPGNQMLTIQSTQKFQKLHSTVTNKNIQDIMLMLKQDVKSSISVP